MKSSSPNSPPPRPWRVAECRRRGHRRPGQCALCLSAHGAVARSSGHQRPLRGVATPRPFWQPRELAAERSRDLKGKRIVTTPAVPSATSWRSRPWRSDGLSNPGRCSTSTFLPSESRILLDNGSADGLSTLGTLTPPSATTRSPGPRCWSAADNLQSQPPYLPPTRQAITDKRQQLETFVARGRSAPYSLDNAHPQEFAAAPAQVTGCRWPCTWRWQQATHKPAGGDRRPGTSAACKPPRTSTARKASSPAHRTSPRASTRASTPRACNSIQASR